jgi:hypothetical protein
VSSSVNEAARAVQKLTDLAERCELGSAVEAEFFLDSNRPEDRWGRDDFDSIEEEYKYRAIAIAIAREARRRFGNLSHDAFLWWR